MLSGTRGLQTIANINMEACLCAQCAGTCKTQTGLILSATMLLKSSSTALVSPDPGCCFSKAHRSFSGLVRNVKNVLSKQLHIFQPVRTSRVRIFVCVFVCMCLSFFYSQVKAPSTSTRLYSEVRMQDKHS